MKVVEWLRRVFRPVGMRGSVAARDVAASGDEPPSERELEAATAELRRMLRPAVYWEIGGERPEKDNRAASWWGGNFLAREGEALPVCTRSGRAMHPLLQLRLDDVAERPEAFGDVALVNVWIDIADVPLGDARNGAGYVVRTYRDLSGLVPLGPGYRESEALPTFPMLRRRTALDQPDWGDVVDRIPPRVARWSDEAWFSDTGYDREALALRERCPVKIGGWPTWIQGADRPSDAHLFAMQIDSTAKGRFTVGDGGSAYLFRTGDDWTVRSDFY